MRCEATVPQSFQLPTSQSSQFTEDSSPSLANALDDGGISLRHTSIGAVGMALATAFLAGCMTPAADRAVEPDAPTASSEVAQTNNWLFEPSVIPEQLSAPLEAAAIVRVRAERNTLKNGDFIDREFVEGDFPEGVAWSFDRESGEIIADTPALDHREDFVLVVFDTNGSRHHLRPVAVDSVSYIFDLQGLPAADGSESGPRVGIARIGVEHSPREKGVVAAEAAYTASIHGLSVLPMPVEGQQYEWSLRSVEFDRPGMTRLTPQDFSGKVVVIDNWSSRCAPCIAMLPDLARLANEHPDDLAIVSINYDDPARRAKGQEFIARSGHASNLHHVHLDGTSEHGALVAQSLTGTSSLGFPLVIVLDRNGRVVSHGPVNGEQLEARLAPLLDSNQRLPGLSALPADR